MSQITQSLDPSTDLSPTAGLPASLPDHTQLPDSDGNFVKNFQEPPEGDLLTDCITPILQQIHPDGQYCIGRDCGIYWRETDPPERGAEAPDWFYVPNVPPMLDGEYRRSYVLWREHIAPFIALEFAEAQSGPDEGDNANIMNYAVSLGFTDFGRKGNFLGLIAGVPPKVIDSDNNAREDDDTTYHLEAFYRIQATNNISITPGFFIITNPEHNADNSLIYVGTIRTSFAF